MNEPKKDCFAYGERSGVCQALKELVCVNEGKCHFYKNKADIDIRDIETDIKKYGAFKN